MNRFPPHPTLFLSLSLPLAAGVKRAHCLQLNLPGLWTVGIHRCIISGTYPQGASTFGYRGVLLTMPRTTIGRVAQSIQIHRAPHKVHSPARFWERSVLIVVSCMGRPESLCWVAHSLLSLLFMEWCSFPWMFPCREVNFPQTFSTLVSLRRLSEENTR